MNDRPRDVVDLLLDAWNHTDPESRRTLLDHLLSADARYTDPDDDVVGADRLDEVMSRVRGVLPAGARFVRVGAASAHHDHVHFAWCLTTPEGGTLATGRDVLTTSGNRITRILGFFDPPA